MYKTKLQELCQRRSWSLPEYQTSREGPEHNPRFTSTVTVNGLSFQIPSPSRTSREAQNSAAKLAFDNFSQPRLPPPSNSTSPLNSFPFPQPSLPQPQSRFPQPEQPPPSISSSPPISSPIPQPSLPQPQSHFPQPEQPPPSISSSPPISSPCPQPSLPQPQSHFPQPKQPHPSISSSPPISSPFPQSSLPQPHSHFAQPKPPSSIPAFSFPQPSIPGFPFPQPSLPPGLSFPQPSLTQPSSTASSSSGSTGPTTDVDNILPKKEVLQPKLQEACQTSQISSPVAAGRDIMTDRDQKDMLRLYKKQLQCYAQKRNLNLPVYSSEWEGPPHAVRFKCNVTLNGQKYASPGFFSTLKDAEHAAAKVALMSLSPGGSQEDDTGLYKNLLQELAQKEGFHLPVYSTQKSGEAHVPVFVSQVEIEGKIFTGQEAKSKKQAEMSAAKVCYTTLKQHKGKSDQSALSHQGQAPEFSSAHSEPNVTTGLQHHADPQSPVMSSHGLVTQKQSDKAKDPVMVTGKKGSSSSGSTNGCTEDSSLSNDLSAPSLSSCNNVVTDTSDVPSTAVGTPSRRRKVVVYSRKTNVYIAEGGTLLPISDDNYVAYSYSQ